MAIAVGLVIVSGFFPILIGTGATDASSQEWTDGYFVRLSGEIGGTWLALWMILAAALSNIGMFVAEMSSDAWMVAGMADRGIIPKVLGQRNAHGTPTFGIMLSATGVIFLSFLSFIDIVDMLNLIFCISQAIEFAAFLYLRAYRSDIHRPYKIPLNLACLCTMLSLPTIFIGVIVYFSSPSCLILSSSVLIIAVLLYYLLEYAREKKLCEFVPYHSYHEPGYICPNEHFDANDVGMLQHMEQQDSMQSNLLPSNSNSDYGSMKHVELHGMNSSACIADDAVELESEAELEEAPNALFMYIQKYMYE